MPIADILEILLTTQEIDTILDHRITTEAEVLLYKTFRKYSISRDIIYII